MPHRLRKIKKGQSLFLYLALFVSCAFTGCGEGTVIVGPGPVPPPISWRGTQQLGTTGNDIGRGIAVDGSTNIYLTGSTGGNLDGNISAGLSDIFLTKFDSSGQKLLTIQFGTTGDDIAYAVAVDSAGNVYIAGSTGGNLDGNISAGLSDIFLTKFNSAGQKLFTIQIGTPGIDFARGVAVDASGNIYVTGATEGNLNGNTSAGLLDIFLTKFNSSGQRLFTIQIGTPGNDIGYGIALDSSGNVYVTGSTDGNLSGTSNGGLDIFLAKFDSSGQNLFTTQFGTPFDDIGRGVAVDGSGNVYVTGSTGGNLNGNISAGSSDIFLAKFDPSGRNLFTIQYGTPFEDIGYGIATDSNNNVHVTGSTGGNLDGNISSGLLDFFLTQFDSSGNKLFTRQFGTTGNDTGYGIAVDSSGNSYVTGSTEGNLDVNTSAGLLDIFLIKFDSLGVKQ